jgi:hypothetical protein
MAATLPVCESEVQASYAYQCQITKTLTGSSTRNCGCAVSQANCVWRERATNLSVALLHGLVVELDVDKRGSTRALVDLHNLVVDVLARGVEGVQVVVVEGALRV